MAHLLHLEQRAAHGQQEKGQVRHHVCRDAQARFLKSHIAWWAPAFAKLLALEATSGFFVALAKFLTALVSVECGLLDIAIESMAVSPSGPELSEACDGCALAI
jgi:TorA maturation chaperone TorD